MSILPSRRIFLPLVTLFLISFPFFLTAQEGRSYVYDRISVTYVVHEDSTVSVTEEMTYDFSGEYHQGWRTLASRGADRISDIRVSDGATGEVFRYVNDELDKTDPASWGAYTTTRSPGATNVIWYYDARDERRTWVLSYVLHGAIAFYDDHDELYWNAVADYDVPVREVMVDVNVDGNVPVESFTATDYPSDGVLSSPVMFRPGGARFFAQNISPGDAYTIALGWPKGSVDVRAYYKDAFLMYWGYLFAILIAIGSIIYAIYFWWTREGRLKGRGVIVPQYEPPEKLKPAMASYIVHERLSPNTWSATLVDLAVRGYVTIDEDRKEYFFKWISSTEYVVKKARAYDEYLEEYEKEFLDALMLSGRGDAFSTREMKKHPSNARKLYQWMQEVEKTLKKEVSTDTGAYEVPPIHDVSVLTMRQGAWVGVLVVRVLAILGGAFSIPFFIGGEFSQSLWVIGACIVAGILVYIVKHDARLNLRGRILREDWLGFKMYLETAERLRLQNLTPETFEKFLPYAMIFGIEKKWAKAFEGVTMPPPNWYHGSSAAFVSAGGGGTSGGFSPSAFATGFSSSFATAFSSSGGGGGASGGGGGAGGGGGGGGGGSS